MTLTSTLPSRDVQVVLATLLVGVMVFSATTVLRSNAGWVPTVGQWLYPTLMLAAAGVVAARAWLGRDERLVWALIAAGMLLPAVRNFLYPPLGSLTALRPLWLLFYPLLFAGLLVLLRTRLKRLPVALGLDALMAGFAVAAVAAIAFGPYHAAKGGSPLTVVLALAFPAGDLFLVAVSAAALSVLGWRTDRRWAFLLAGFVLYAVADTLLMAYSIQGTYLRGSWFDTLRPAAALLVAGASWMVAEPTRPRRPIGFRSNAFPQLICTLLLVGVLVLSYDARLPRITVVLAGVGLVVVTIRFALAFRDVSRLAHGHRRAMTDDVTLLANRRSMSTALTAAAFEYSLQQGDSRGPGLLLLDLDGFTDITEALGQHVGDQVLCQVADRLARSTRSEDLLARVGDDEFAVLLPVGTELSTAKTLAGRIGAALDAPFVVSGTSVCVRAAIGIALCPEHCPHPQDLLQCADVAMCRAKGTPGRVAVYGPGRATYR